MAEQRYKAVLAVIGDGRSVSEVAASWDVSRQTLHAWLARSAARCASRSRTEDRSGADGADVDGLSAGVCHRDLESVGHLAVEVGEEL